MKESHSFSSDCINIEDLDSVGEGINFTNKFRTIISQEMELPIMSWILRAP